MQLQQSYDQFQALNTAVIAVSQEDKDLESAGGMARRFQGGPPFEILHDLDRQATGAYDRTTAYLINRKGKVEQVFPMLIHMRPSWETILREVEKLEAPASREEAGMAK